MIPSAALGTWVTGAGPVSPCSNATASGAQPGRLAAVDPGHALDAAGLGEALERARRSQQQASCADREDDGIGRAPSSCSTTSNAHVAVPTRHHGFHRCVA